MEVYLFDRDDRNNQIIKHLFSGVSNSGILRLKPSSKLFKLNLGRKYRSNISNRFSRHIQFFINV